MYKEGILNLVPILYGIIPSILGLMIGFILKKRSAYKILGSLTTAIFFSGLYLIIIRFCTVSKNESGLFIFLFIWNTILMFMVSNIYLFLYKIRNIRS